MYRKDKNRAAARDLRNRKTGYVQQLETECVAFLSSPPPLLLFFSSSSFFVMAIPNSLRPLSAILILILHSRFQEAEVERALLAKEHAISQAENARLLGELGQLQEQLRKCQDREARAREQLAKAPVDPRTLLTSDELELLLASSRNLPTDLSELERLDAVHSQLQLILHPAHSGPLAHQAQVGHVGILLQHPLPESRDLVSAEGQKHETASEEHVGLEESALTWPHLTDPLVPSSDLLDTLLRGSLHTADASLDLKKPSSPSFTILEEATGSSTTSATVGEHSSAGAVEHLAPGPAKTATLHQCGAMVILVALLLACSGTWLPCTSEPRNYSTATASCPPPTFSLGWLAILCLCWTASSRPRPASSSSGPVSSLCDPRPASPVAPETDVVYDASRCCCCGRTAEGCCCGCGTAEPEHDDVDGGSSVPAPVRVDPPTPSLFVTLREWCRALWACGPGRRHENIPQFQCLS